MNVDIARTSRRRALGASATAILIVLTSLMGSTAAHADDSAAAPISPAEQRGFEAELNDFLAAQPEPAAPKSGASVAEKNAYATELAAWWTDVPWDAVAGQWGCAAGIDEVNFNPADEDGVVTASHGGIMHCAVTLSDAELTKVAVPQTRSVSESEFSILARFCDFPGGDDYCLDLTGTTLTASFQYQQAGNITGRARAGQPGFGASCGLGTQIALGPLGIGNQGSVWYAAGTVNQNSYWSSSFIVGTSGVYGTWCATI